MRTEEMQVDRPLVDTIESEPFTVPTDDQEVVVITRSGDATAWDVWVDVPASWEADVELRIYARTGSSRLLVKKVEFGELTGTPRIVGLLCSVRGRPCSTIEIVVWQQTGSPISDGRIELHAWVGTEQLSIETPLWKLPTVVRGSETDGSLQIKPSGGSLLIRGSGTSGSVGVEPQGGSLLIRGSGTSGSVGVEPQGGSMLIRGSGTSNSVGIEPIASASILVRQSTAAAQSGRWPIYLSDGTNERGTTTNPLITREPRASNVLSATTAKTTSMTTTTSPTATHAFMWITGTNTRKAEILAITIAYSGAATSGDAFFRIGFITAFNTGTGASSAVSWDRGVSPPSGVYSLYTGATSFTAGSELWADAAPGNGVGSIVWKPAETGQALYLRGNASEGIRVRSEVNRNLSSALDVIVTIHWIEV